MKTCSEPFWTLLNWIWKVGIKDKEMEPWRNSEARREASRWSRAGTAGGPTSARGRTERSRWGRSDCQASRPDFFRAKTWQSWSCSPPWRPSSGFPPEIKYHFDKAEGIQEFIRERWLNCFKPSCRFRLRAASQTEFKFRFTYLAFSFLNFGASWVRYKKGELVD